MVRVLYIILIYQFLSIAQPKRLVTKTELLLMNILNAHESDDATVVRAGVYTIHFFIIKFYIFSRRLWFCFG
jgi:hypothetical protein